MANHIPTNPVTPVMVIAAMAEIANHAGKGPLLSLDTASWLFDRASFVLVGSLIIGAIATVTIVWTGIEKEHHWDLLRESAAEKIAAVELEAAKLNEEAAKAHERIAELSNQGDQLRKDTAEANARAAQANLQVEYLKKLRGPRSVPYNALDELRSLPSRTAQIWYVKGADDAEKLAGTMAGALQHAGWKAGVREIASAKSAGGEPTGVTVLDNQFSGPSNPATVLVDALKTVLGECFSNIGKDLPEGTVRIIVGPKP